MDTKLLIEIIALLNLLIWLGAGYWLGAGRTGFALLGVMIGIGVGERWSEQLGAKLAPIPPVNSGTAELIVFSGAILICSVVLGLGGGSLVVQRTGAWPDRLAGVLLGAGAALVGTIAIAQAYIDRIPSGEVAIAIEESTPFQRLLGRELDVPTAIAIAVALFVIPAAIVLPSRRAKQIRLARKAKPQLQPVAASEPAAPQSADWPTGWPQQPTAPVEPLSPPPAPTPPSPQASSWGPPPAARTTCPACGTILGPQDRFCPRCGRLR